MAAKHSYAELDATLGRVADEKADAVAEVVAEPTPDPIAEALAANAAETRALRERIEADAAARLANIEPDLQQRLEEASTQQWLADVEQLRVTLRRLQDKKTTLGRGEAQPRGLQGFTVHPPLDVPAAADHVGVYNPPHHL